MFTTARAVPYPQPDIFSYIFTNHFHNIVYSILLKPNVSYTINFLHLIFSIKFFDAFINSPTPVKSPLFHLFRLDNSFNIEWIILITFNVCILPSHPLPPMPNIFSASCSQAAAMYFLLTGWQTKFPTHLTHYCNKVLYTVICRGVYGMQRL